MRVTAAFTIFAFSASAIAYEVIVPSPSQGWTNNGAQTVSWQLVPTDPSNFTIVLTNTNREVMPQNDLVLDALVVGSLLTTKVNPPSAGWPTGGTFRVNLVKDTEDLNTILAQSDEFNITEPTTATSSSGSTTGSSISPSASSISTTTVSTVVATTTSAATDSKSESTGTAASSASPSTTSNAAVSGINTQTGLIGIVGLLGLFFA